MVKIIWRSRQGARSAGGGGQPQPHQPPAPPLRTLLKVDTPQSGRGQAAAALVQWSCPRSAREATVTSTPVRDRPGVTGTTGSQYCGAAALRKARPEVRFLYRALLLSTRELSGGGGKGGHPLQGAIAAVTQRSEPQA